MKIASIQFDTTTTMETFCLEPLNIADTCQISFRADFIKRCRPNKCYTIMSFFNIPAEADIQLLNDFLDQFPDIEGEGRYQTKKFNDIQHKTGTITYKVSNIVIDISRYNNLFSRSIKCIYDNQPYKTKEGPTKKVLTKKQRETKNMK